MLDVMGTRLSSYSSFIAVHCALSILMMCVHVHGRRRTHVIACIRRDHVANFGIRVLLEVDVRALVQLLDDGAGLSVYQVRLLEHLWV